MGAQLRGTVRRLLLPRLRLSWVWKPRGQVRVQLMATRVVILLLLRCLAALASSIPLSPAFLQMVGLGVWHERRMCDMVSTSWLRIAPLSFSSTQASTLVVVVVVVLLLLLLLLLLLHPKAVRDRPRGR